MACRSEAIIISSDEEENEVDVMFVKEVKIPSDKKDSVVSPSKFKIDSIKLKHLRNAVKRKFENNVGRKKESKDTDDSSDVEGIPFSPKNEPVETVDLALEKSLSNQKNLMQDLKSAVSNKNASVTNSESLFSPEVHSPIKTPQKTQSSITTWVTSANKMRNQPSSTLSHDINAKRNELVWPPRHVISDRNKFISELYSYPREFPKTYEYMIESLQDEEFFISVVNSINSLMSNDLAPSTEMIWYLVNNILSSSSDSWLVCSTYSLLNNILERYPTKCIAMNIEWGDIKKHFSTVEAKKDRKCSSKKPDYSKLVLSFLLSVLSAELKATALKSKRRSRLTKYFSADFDVSRVKDVIPHLKGCLENHNEPTPISCSFGKKKDVPETAGICGIQLCQNFLKLFMIASEDKENAALRLANELMYLYIDLPNLQQRVLLVQTVTSHLVRVHLIKILLMNYCSLLPEALQGVNLPLSVRKIFLQDFYREPPNRQADERGHSVEDIEEYITLLAYMMQSYVRLHSPFLRNIHNDYPLFDHNDAMKEFSEEDLSYLREVKDHLSGVRTRCKSFLKKDENLSSRTNFLLQLMKFNINV